MKAFDEFIHADDSFWALVKYISSDIGYTLRGHGKIKTYTTEQIKASLAKNKLWASQQTIDMLKQYVDKRAEILNGYAQTMLMNADMAKTEFMKLQPLHAKHNYKCALPMNKQKGPKKQIAFFTAMINIIAESVIREYQDIPGSTLGFQDDPRELICFINDRHELLYTSSRRLDGAYPSTRNPKIVWEIKEYYYTTTFGSRVADGVYETQLDGYELNQIENKLAYPVKHILFIDAYKTWWEDGKAYLCRIIDMINARLVDEVIIGREVFTRWPQLLRETIESER